MTAPAATASALPTGTVTFLRTDVERSLALVRSVGAHWDELNAAHLAIVRGAVADAGGVVVRTEGDAVFAVFAEAGAGVAAAAAAQRELTAYDWPAGAQVKVRMALHTGEAHLAGDDYGGFEVNRAARLAAVGHGGQVVLSATTATLVAGSLADGLGLRDLGTYAVRDLPLPERLHQLVVPGLPVAFPPLRAATPTAGALPPRLTPLVGRDEELDSLRAALATTRLLTLTGPGGIGKTSLATELARSVAADYADGACLVLLDAVDAAGVRGAVARAVGLVDGPERSAGDAVERYLRDREVLLLLDNFEHVLAAADLVPALLAASPRSRLVVTSRAALRVRGEQEVAVRPLEDAAVELFTERARAVRPGWVPGADAEAVREVCRLVDGLPLGIELAAARVATLPVRAIRDRLAARLPLPGTSPRDLPERQRTLDATIAWSIDLLDPELRHLLGDLAVFEGGFDVEQVQAVHDPDAGAVGVDVLDGVVRLAEHSLVVAETAAADEPDDVGSGSRFRLLRTVADAAARRVQDEGREEDLRGRHARAYLALAERARPHLMGREQRRWFRRLGPDADNLVAAASWAVEHDVTVALRLGAALWRFWQQAGHLAAGRELLERALALPAAQSPSPARLAALPAVGGLAYWQGDQVAAARWYAEQLTLARALGDRVAEVDALFNLAHTDTFGLDRSVLPAHVVDDVPEDPDERVEVLERAYRELGDAIGLTRVRWIRAVLAFVRGDVEASARLHDGLYADFLRLGDPLYAAMTAGDEALLAFVREDVRSALQWGVRSMVERYEVGDRATTAISFEFVAVVAARLGLPEESAVLVGAFDGSCERFGVRPPSQYARTLGLYDPPTAASSGLDEEAYAAAYQRGRRLSFDAAMRLLVELQERAG